MATDPDHRGTGMGGALLARCAEYVVDAGGSEIWCTARIVASDFYVKRGFEPVGAPFDFHGLGPHLVMVGDPDEVSRAG